MTVKPPQRYLVAGSKSWNARIFQQVIARYPGHWAYIDSKEQLTLDFVARIEPRYIFFLHWSWIVPDALIERYECVCFHMTDVPYGRGGSPLQNLILRGHRDTMVTALRMVSELDAGPVYLKRKMGLEGSAAEIYERASAIAAEMILRLIESEPAPAPQQGQAVVFARRRPEQSVLPPLGSLTQLYDFIRMLDAEGYPRACLLYNGFRYEFGRAALREGSLTAEVRITPIDGDDQ